MGFKEEVQTLAIQVSERKVHITNEEMTKTALIMPFIQVLGYDIFNPLEVKPEYIADFGKKKGEKVDYALYKDGVPIAFIEAKSVSENLVNYDSQLARYFNAVPEVKLGIITNGVEYKFFTDLKTNNVMDETPFLLINLADLHDNDIEVLSKFRKNSFDKENLFRFAEELVYTSALNSALKELFKNPSDEFVRFLIKDYSDTRITTNVIERFRPIVKVAISNAILDIVSKGLIQQDFMIPEDKPQDKIDKQDAAKASTVATVSADGSGDDIVKKPVTTEDELKSFEFVKTILQQAGKPIDKLSYKDTISYFSIQNINSLKWFLRIYIDGPNKNLTIRLMPDAAEKLATGFKVIPAPKGIGESRIQISTVEDIKKLDKLIVACFDDANLR